MRFGELQLLRNPPLAEFPQPGLIPKPRHLIERPHQLLRPVHLGLRRFSQEPSHHALQRLKEHHGQKQQQRRRRLRWQVMLPPQTRSSHKTQVQQRQKHHEYRVDQIPLPPDLQKVEPLHVSNQQNERNEYQNQQQGGQRRPRFRPEHTLLQNHSQQQYRKHQNETQGDSVK